MSRQTTGDARWLRFEDSTDAGDSSAAATSTRQPAHNTLSAQNSEHEIVLTEGGRQEPFLAIEATGRTQDQDSGRRTSLMQPRSRGSMRHGHRVPVSQYLALAIWELLLCLQYALIRYVCTLGIPHDCHDHSDPVKFMTTIQYLLFPGFVLAIFTGMHWPDRFEYIFSFRQRLCLGWLFLPMFFGFGVFWGSLDLVPAFRHFSLTEVSAGYLLLFLLLGAGFLLILGWHVMVAYRFNSKAGFAAYIISRLAMLVFYTSYLLFKLADQPGLQFHFHHYAFGYILASLAEFNHPISILLLAGGTSVFVQGLAAYGADNIIGHHVQIHTESGLTYTSPEVSFEAFKFFTEHCHSKWAESPVP